MRSRTAVWPMNGNYADSTRTPSRRVALCGLLVSAVCLAYRPAACETPVPVASPTPSLTPRNDLPGVKNFTQVSPFLWRSAQPTAEGFRQLRQMGLRTVVNLRNVASDRKALAGTGLGYVHIHFATWHAEDEDTVRFLRVVTDPERQPVLVHCRRGADRTGMMVAIYRVYAQGWTQEEALAELPRFGYSPVWSNLKRFFRRLDFAGLRRKVEAAPAPKVEIIQ
jgi:protein tyrosine phosphatase (PTP) superfamily phosphohydrolase (DUF442 family)